MILDVVINLLSTEAFDVISMIPLMFTLKSYQAFLSAAAGHLIFFPNVLDVPGNFWASDWRDWVL